MVQSRIGKGDTVGIMVRVEQDLRDRIKSAAEESGRSMNSEIVSALEENYPAPVSTDIELQDLVRIMEQIASLPPEQREAELKKLNHVFHGVNTHVVLTEDGFQIDYLDPERQEFKSYT